MQLSARRYYSDYGDDQPTSVEWMRFSTAGVLLRLLVNLFSTPTGAGGLFVSQASHSKCLRLLASR
jgi:hypothetical protein